MNINDNDYVLGMWIVAKPGVRDWLGTVKRPGGDPTKPWELEYRFRYYEDDKVFDSEDRKTLTRGTCDAATPEAKIEMTMNVMMVGLQQAGFGNHMEHIEIKGGPEKMMECMAHSDMMHVKSVSPEEADRLGFKKED